MSGGALDYSCFKVDSITEQLNEVMEGMPYSKEVEAMECLQFFLEMSSEGLKATEWWLSGDTDSKPLLEWRKRL